MDNRGTGRSGALVCPELQAAEQWTVEIIGRCGASLGESAPFYGTSYATDDLAAILEALEAPRVDLYGDSYGTYFAQVFAVRHPERLRSIVLDGAYPLGGPDYAWYPNYAPAMRAKFDIACRRFAPCAELGGNSIDHVRPALELLRVHPFDARVRDGEGRDRPLRGDASMLATVMFAAAPAFASTRELDAAARALIAGDRAPLTRLMGETRIGVDLRDPTGYSAPRDPTADAARWSAALSIDAMCEDTPQIFDMRLLPERRRLERDRALESRRRSHPDTYAPFTLDEFRGMPLDYSFLDQCVAWPVTAASHPPDRPVPLQAAYPDVPALVISGEFDDMTTPAEGAAAAAAFKRGTQVLVVNSFRVNALSAARSDCAANIVRHFIEHLEPGDTSCAAAVPPLRLVPRFARRAAEMEPLTAREGNDADAGRLRLAAAALATVGDVLARPDAVDTGSGVGLRGGRYTVAAHGAAATLRLNKVRWTEDVAASGVILRSGRRPAEVHAHLRVKAADGMRGDLEIRWSEADAAPTALIEGSWAAPR